MRVSKFHLAATLLFAMAHLGLHDLANAQALQRTQGQIAQPLPGLIAPPVAPTTLPTTLGTLDFASAMAPVSNSLVTIQYGCTTCNMRYGPSPEAMAPSLYLATYNISVTVHQPAALHFAAGSNQGYLQMAVLVRGAYGRGGALFASSKGTLVFDRLPSMPASCPIPAGQATVCRLQLPANLGEAVDLHFTTYATGGTITPLDQFEFTIE